MTEDDAQQWVLTHFGSAAQARLAVLGDMVARESRLQNLVAPSTLGTMWARHLVDSAQLVTLFGQAGPGTWLDIGSGAGFPGLVVALLTDRKVVLVEPRRRRAEFLVEAAARLGVSERVDVQQVGIDRITIPAAVISARAVAPLSALFGLALQCATASTAWVLPKGRTAREEVARAQETWQGVFHVEHSITDPQSLIVLASGVSRR